jgi:cytosine/adenosine deaminase-related metal-dependent hydrolase
MNPDHRPRSPWRAASATILALLLSAAILPAAEKTFPGLVVANAIITPLDWSDKEPYRGYMIVGPDGRIAALGAGDAPASSVPVLDVGGKIVMPGFLSVHSHLAGSVSRGRAADQWVTEWRLSGSRSRPGVEVNPEGNTYSTTLHGAMDFLFGGVTTVYNYASMGRTPQTVDETLQAVLDAGGHYVFGTNIPENSPDREELADYLRKFVAGVKSHPGSERILKLSMSSVAMRWTEEESKFEFELLKSIPEFGMDIEMHYLEPPPNVPRTVYERSNFVWLEKYGILGPNITFAHFIHPTDEILAKSAAAGVTMSWNPLSNGRLASGLTDVVR